MGERNAVLAPTSLALLILTLASSVLDRVIPELLMHLVPKTVDWNPPELVSGDG